VLYHWATKSFIFFWEKNYWTDQYFLQKQTKKFWPLKLAWRKGIRMGDYTLGGIASICFKFHFQTDDQQTLRTHTQGCQGCQKIRNLLRISKILIARSTIHPSLSKIKNHYWKTSKIEKKNYQSINGDFFTTKKYFSIWKLNFFAIFLMNFAAFFNGFWFYSILAGWSTWQWVFLNFSQNFWSFDTPDTHGCASAVIWNRFEPFLLQCNT
jgi:hypothetical protein